MRMAELVRCAVLSATAAWLAALPVRATDSELNGFAGTWVRAERERDDANRDAVIQQATEPMSFAFRVFARGVMRRRMVPPENWEVAKDAGSARIRNSYGEVIRIDGRPHETHKGHEVTARFSGDGEIQLLWRHGADSHGMAVLRLDQAGQRLVVTETVNDPHFEAPVEYTTSYRHDD